VCLITAFRLVTVLFLAIPGKNPIQTDISFILTRICTWYLVKRRDKFMFISFVWCHCHVQGFY